MTETYRVIVRGTGGVGTAVLPEAQAILRVCAHEPGIIGPAPVGPHWTAAYGRTHRAAAPVGSNRSSR